MQVVLNLPEAVSAYINLNDPNYLFNVRELMMYALVRENKISFGKAAELLGIGKMKFITDLGSVGIPYFDQSFDEVMEDAELAHKFWEAR
ncbi:MAG: UPF0175 family protein [Oscillospiraceae bacterium]|nr:UPF0175 family protein [Oscillospiraceae bacterium]